MDSVLLLSASPLKFLENTLRDYLGLEEKHLFLDALQFSLEGLCQCRKVNEWKLKTEFLKWWSFERFHKTGLCVTNGTTWIIKFYKGKHFVDITLPTLFQMFQIRQNPEKSISYLKVEDCFIWLHVAITFTNRELKHYPSNGGWLIVFTIKDANLTNGSLLMCLFA